MNAVAGCETGNRCGSTLALDSYVVSGMYRRQRIKWGQATFYHVTGKVWCMINLHMSLCFPYLTTGVKTI